MFRRNINEQVSQLRHLFVVRVPLGDPGGSRTHNLLLRTELLYPVELPGHQFFLNGSSLLPFLKFSGKMEIG